MKHLRNALRWPELTLAGFAFLLNFPWEMIQSPLFEGMASMPHRNAVQYCTRAAFGDAGIMVIAFWIAGAASGSGRGWLQQSGRVPIAIFVIIGVSISIASRCSPRADGGSRDGHTQPTCRSCGA